LVSVRHLLGKHQHLRPGKRTDLIQSLLEGDFNYAQRLLSNDKKSPTVMGSVVTAVGALLPSLSSAESLKKEMKVLAAQQSDSQFLLELKGVDNKELLSMIQDIETLVHSLHSSLIDKTVGAMTHTVVAMQQEHRKRAIQDELKNEEMKLRNEALVEFIRELNVQSARRQDS
jgi:hypothetical protein